MEELVGEIISADGTYQYDDTNYTDFPRGKGNLVEGQEQYTFSAEYLQIESIEVLNQGGTVYEKIQTIDNVDLGGMSPQQYFGTDSSGNPVKGRVQYYDVSGDSVIFYPAPTSTSHTLTNGMRIWFKRKPQAFTAVSTTATDTTEPGLPSSYHVILAYMAAIPYCMSYKKDRVALYEKKKDELKKNILKYYGLRERDRKKIMTMKQVNYI